MYISENEREIRRRTIWRKPIDLLGAKIKKVGDSDFEGLVLDYNDYEGKINHIEIPHDRKRRGNGALTEADQSILRSGSGELMWIARIARHGEIYDASFAAQTSTE